MRRKGNLPTPVTQSSSVATSIPFDLPPSHTPKRQKRFCLSKIIGGKSRFFKTESGILRRLIAKIRTYNPE
jgi:hypothetical protein